MKNRLPGLIPATLLFLTGAIQLEAVPKGPTAPLLAVAPSPHSPSPQRGAGRNSGHRRARRAPRGAFLFRALHSPEMRQELGLTEAQVQSLTDLSYETRGRQIELQGALRTKRLELQRILQDTSAERIHIDSLVDQLSEINADRLRARINARLTLREVLTQEQQERLRDLLRDRRADLQGPRRGRHSGR